MSQLLQQIKEIYPLKYEEIKRMIVVARQCPYKYIGQKNIVVLMFTLDCELLISEVTGLEERNVLTNQIAIRNSKNNKDRSVVFKTNVK